MQPCERCECGRPCKSCFRLCHEPHRMEKPGRGTTTTTTAAAAQHTRAGQGLISILSSPTPHLTTKESGEGDNNNSSSSSNSAGHPARQKLLSILPSPAAHVTVTDIHGSDNETATHPVGQGVSSTYSRRGGKRIWAVCIFDNPAGINPLLHGPADFLYLTGFVDEAQQEVTVWNVRPAYLRTTKPRYRSRSHCSAQMVEISRIQHVAVSIKQRGTVVDSYVKLYREGARGPRRSVPGSVDGPRSTQRDKRSDLRVLHCSRQHSQVFTSATCYGSSRNLYQRIFPRCHMLLAAHTHPVNSTIALSVWIDDKLISSASCKQEVLERRQHEHGTQVERISTDFKIR